MDLQIISGNAGEGADRLIAEIAQELGIRLRSLSKEDFKQCEIRPEPNETDIQKKQREEKEIQCYYNALAKYISENSKYLIAVWDGVFNYKAGGTSDTVKMALESKRHIAIYHLICPRVSNHFPVNSLAAHAIDYKARVFSRIPFTVNFTWTERTTDKTPKDKNHTYQYFKDIRTFLGKTFKRQLFWYFMIPVMLSIVTIILGTYGFGKIYKDDCANNFFRAVNLITLNESVIEAEMLSDGEIIKPGFGLEFARITGLLTIIFAFIYALLLALKDFRENFIRLIWRYREFNVVIGLSERSMDLIKSLSGKNKPVVLLTERESSAYDNELQQIPRLIVVRGSLSSASMLQTVYAMKAKEIFILSDNDTKNIRAAQELDIMSKQKDANTPKIFVHLQNEDSNKFLRNSLSHIHNYTTIFNIYENIARRLFLHFPPDRFYQSPGSNVLQAVIIGFDEMGRKLLQTLLKQGHYQKDKKVRITVYCSNADDCEADFQHKNPLFFADAADGVELKSIKEEVWQNISLSFLELPHSDAVWLDDEQPFYRDLDERHIVTIYTGLDNGIAAASYLNCILPKLNYLKVQTNCNIQVFCYYNFPDKKEETNIEAYLNRQAPELFVKCFGNFLDECSVEPIKSMALDEMAKLINAFYCKQELFKGVPIERWKIINADNINDYWMDASAKDRISSQQAGDHLWAKLRMLHTLKNWSFDTLDYTLTEGELFVLGEIEHRRWSAELLLQGFVPFKITKGPDEYDQYVKKWNNKEDIIPELVAERKAFKKEMQDIKRHINLVAFERLYETESAKDYDQINAIPYFLKQILPSGFGQIKNKNQNKIQFINKNPDLAYLLLYAANIDNNIREEEKELIKSHLRGHSQWQYLIKQFEKMNEKERADRLLEIINAADNAEKQIWIQSVKELMKSDGRFSGVEQYILGLLKMS